MHTGYNILNIHTQGLYQKAETMYAMGDFEYALVFYHRGDKIRPDIKAFKLGIQKAQEAINNSIGCKSVAHMCLDINSIHVDHYIIEKGIMCCSILVESAQCMVMS